MLLKDYLQYLLVADNNDFSKNNQIDILKVKHRVLKDFFNSKIYLYSRIHESENNNIFFAGEYIKEIYSLNELEWFCIIISIMNMDNKYKNLISKILGEENDNITYELIFKIYYCVSEINQIEDVYTKIIELRKKMDLLCFKKGTLIIDHRLLNYIFTNGAYEIGIEGIKTYRYNNDTSYTVNLRNDIVKKIYMLSKNNEIKKSVYFFVYGKEGIGKKTLVKRVAKSVKQNVIFIDLAEFLNKSPDAKSQRFTIFREALIQKASICIYNFEFICGKNAHGELEYFKDFLDYAKVYSKFIFILSLKDYQKLFYIDETIAINIELQDLSKNESILLWKYYLKDLKNIIKLDANEIGNKFNFTCGQITNTIRDFKHQILYVTKEEINKKLLYNCAYKQVIDNLSNNKATIIHPKYTWNDLILNPDEKEMLLDACSQIKFKHIVYERWGMSKRISYGRGLSMLFAGPPGTGKTMAAQVIGNELNMEIYKVDLSQVVSKYIGETEKNLGEIFDEARESNVILFFDETDALFGKRTEVKDSHDKNANVETSYLLQKMEEYDGITIMTTNFVNNIDKAFFRRISYVVHFAFPDKTARKKIWINMFPKEMPLSKNIDWDYLSSQFEISGGSIKNIAIVSAFMAAKERQRVCMKHILKAVRYELKKQGKMMLKNDFGEYGYLFDK